MFEWCRGFTLYPEPKLIEAVERAIVQFGDKALGRLERLARKSSSLQNSLFYVLSHSNSQRAVQILVHHVPKHP